MKNFLLFLWQLPQNIIGMIISLTSQKKKEVIFNDGTSGKVYYKKNFLGSGISLGSFIILDYLYSTFDDSKDVNHEHGHQIQSKIFGPLYLIVIGIPSALRNLYDGFFHSGWSFKKRNDWYYKSYPENWADKLGGVER